jgi:phosphoribosylamine--glycine ligase
MKVLVIGNGGREHALVWKLAQSPLLSRLYCAPGNAGTAAQAENVPINVDDIASLLAFARAHAIDFTVVGPELPLALGIVDTFRQQGLAIFGPTQKAAQLETSKTFAKTIMAKYGIPTAPFRTFSDPQHAEAYIDQHKMPLVVKADGLAAGKGVIVCKTRERAHHAIEQIMRAKVFGEAGAQVVIEAFLQGEEVSFFALTDGTSLVPWPACQDHKAIFDADEGPNTGGMGAYSPVPVVDVALSECIMEEIMRPTVRAMAAEGRLYQGVLYAGLMVVNRRLWVIEFNARLGDPEAQALMLRLDSDLLPRSSDPAAWGSRLSCWNRPSGWATGDQRRPRPGGDCSGTGPPPGARPRLPDRASHRLGWDALPHRHRPKGAGAPVDLFP